MARPDHVVQACWRERAKAAAPEMVAAVLATIDRFEAGEAPLDVLDTGDLEIVAAIIVALSQRPHAHQAVKDLATAHRLDQSLAATEARSGDSPSVTPTAVEGAGGSLGAMAPPAPEAIPELPPGLPPGYRVDVVRAALRVMCPPRQELGTWRLVHGGVEISRVDSMDSFAAKKDLRATAWARFQDERQDL